MGCRQFGWPSDVLWLRLRNEGWDLRPCGGQCSVSNLSKRLSSSWLLLWLLNLHLHLHLGFVHPLQDVALHQCLPSSSVCCFPNPGGSLPLSVMSSCHLLLGRPLVLFPLLGCHSVHRFVHLLSFNLAIWPAHFHFCFSVYSIILMTSTCRK